jgi:hypothetical protein
MEDIVSRAIAEGTGTDGPALFGEVKTILHHYLHWPPEWCYDLGALWVIQAYLANSLQSVFYLHFSATKGRGKTTALDLLADLTSGLNASNVSVAALVHWLGEHPCGAVLVDEFDVARNAEADPALASIARDGYTRGKPYLRWDPTRKIMDECPTYGAKAFGFRGSVDDALEDRGFTLPLPSVALRGKEGAKLVARNMSRSVGNLPARLRTWSNRTGKGWEPPDFETEEWLAKLEAVVGESYGANRETQLSMVVLSVADAAGVDVSDPLRAALGLKREVAEANVSEDLEEGQAILSEMFARTGTLTGEAEYYVVKQADFFRELNARRKERGLRPLDPGKRAALREDLGIDKAWMPRVNGFPTWKIPKKEWDAHGSQNRGKGTPGREDTPPPPPTPPHGDPDRGRMGRMGRGGVPEPPLAPSGPVPEEDLLGPGPTRADRALANARREGSLATPLEKGQPAWKAGTSPGTVPASPTTGEVKVRVTDPIAITISDGTTLCEGEIVSLAPGEAEKYITEGRARRWGP